MSNVPLILAMLLIIILIPPVEKITWLWLLIIPALALQSVFNLGIGLILARIISRVHDATHLLPFFMRAWMYGSAIFYSYEKFVTHPGVLGCSKGESFVQCHRHYSKLCSVRSAANLAILGNTVGVGPWCTHRRIGLLLAGGGILWSRLSRFSKSRAIPVS